MIIGYHLCYVANYTNPFLIMSKNAVFPILVATLVITGGYGIKSIFQNEISTPNPYSQNTSSINKTTESAPTNTNESISEPHKIVPQESEHKVFELILTDISQLLENERFIAAVKLLDINYHRLSTEELIEFEKVFLSVAWEHSQQKNLAHSISLLSSYSETFNSLEGWTLLSNIHLKNKDWQSAIMALLNVASLEYQPDKLELVMANLVSAASQQRAIMQTQNDELGINQLYKSLHENHPNFARFQLELALSYLRLDDTKSAVNLLHLLQYDAQYGAIAQSTLSKLNNNPIAENSEDQSNAKESINSNEIVVPLLRSGNSFFANTVINNRQLRLLLDTGASITALSKSTIESLRLKPTGRTIKLSTANGVTQAKLYRANQIQLGGLTIKNLVVAEIEFDKNSQIHGLLGTDLLNQLDNRYSYLIDNQRNALIFETRR